MSKGDRLDPKGLIDDAYRIEGISAPECRSIFLDWALSYDGAPYEAIAALLERYAAQPAEHPMTLTLREGLGSDMRDKTGRRGGRAGRLGQPDGGPDGGPDEAPD
jgi:hypothetical protein